MPETKRPAKPTGLTGRLEITGEGFVANRNLVSTIAKR